MDENEIKEKIKIKLDQIAEEIYLMPDKNDIGLLTGNSGIVLFLAYYSKFNNDAKYAHKISELIGENLKIIEEGYNYDSFCSGITGFLWSLTHLVKYNFLDKEETLDILNETDEFIYKCMMTNVDAKKFDFMHESIGIGIYFLERVKDNPMSKKYLEDLINGLELSCEKEEDGGLKWVSYNHTENKLVFNLSLSHGIASIIEFLGKAYKKNIYKEKVKFLLNGSIKFLLNHIKDPLLNGSYFPSWVYDNEAMEKSRLGWCYGDLGIAMVLYQTGEILKDDSLKEISIKIMTFNSERRILKSEYVVDAGICHGTAGIAHIFNRMYKYTGKEKYKETSDFWLKETLKMARFEDGVAGYKAWHSTVTSWVKEYGILEGVAGVGLSFISAISDVEPSWDECLLLS